MDPDDLNVDIGSEGSQIATRALSLQRGNQVDCAICQPTVKTLRDGDMLPSELWNFTMNS